MGITCARETCGNFSPPWLSALQRSRNMPERISISDFVVLTNEDLSSPGTSSFQSKMSDCRSTVSTVEEVREVEVEVCRGRSMRLCPLFTCSQSWGYMLLLRTFHLCDKAYFFTFEGLSFTLRVIKCFSRTCSTLDFNCWNETESWRPPFVLRRSYCLAYLPLMILSLS